MMKRREFGKAVAASTGVATISWTTRSFPASPFPHTMYSGDLSFASDHPRGLCRRARHRAEPYPPIFTSPEMSWPAAIPVKA